MAVTIVSWTSWDLVLERLPFGACRVSLTSSMYAKGFRGFYRNSEYIDIYTIYDKNIHVLLVLLKLNVFSPNIARLWQEAQQFRRRGNIPMCWFPLRHSVWEEAEHKSVEAASIPSWWTWSAWTGSGFQFGLLTPPIVICRETCWLWVVSQFGVPPSSDPRFH